MSKQFDFGTLQREEIRGLLNYIRENPAANYPIGWIDEVIERAIEAGMMKAKRTLGVNIPANPYPATYGGDLEEVF